MPADLATDPEAQRFHALRRLVEDGVVRPDEADARRNANLGAMLPYSMPSPADGLARVAPLQDIARRLGRLSVQPGPATGAERDLLLDAVLPAQPRTRTPPPRGDAAALKLGRDRVERLAGLGLVAPDERHNELEAIGQREKVLANQPPPPPPEPPKKKKPVRKKPPVGSEGGSKPGDVPGGAIPPKDTKGPMGVHLLSMASDNLTDKAVDALKKEFPEQLGALTFKAVKTEIPDLGTTYRLLAGPLSAADSEQLCKALRAKGQSCAVAAF
ncbi:hypothetical protein A6A04_00310 [Paramagnetospirillum marisnigri]|uniref:SPOR domain-containing protein n=2 Tax=Paramagnetospirillum marisnigri TaxID=1285242 RepID=A0A178MSN3_9PROT|nr:hypothetical protein A6A04_00310 [Paramagnetospirillum marisnigri]